MVIKNVTESDETYDETVAGPGAPSSGGRVRLRERGGASRSDRGIQAEVGARIEEGGGSGISSG